VTPNFIDETNYPNACISMAGDLALVSMLN
jgi:hypothetical protein